MSDDLEYSKVPLEKFEEAFAGLTEVSSAAIGAEVLSFSDQFFAPASDLIKPGPAQSLKGQFGPNGALYDGWETRRHNREFDWVIIRLGPPGSTLSAFDIDTTNFNGNEGPAAEVLGLFHPPSSTSPPPPYNSRPWIPLLPVLPLGPNQRHLFKLPAPSPTLTHVQLRMIPDGGIARFRAYGEVEPLWPESATEEGVDLASVFQGGKVVFTSDQHFGKGANLILPGRGVDMGDGWETRRSRISGHKDWVNIQLGAPGYLYYTEIDTAHFKGNFPASVTLHAIHSPSSPPTGPNVDADGWTEILGHSKVGPHAQHWFALGGHDKVWTHVRVTIYPDGGIKRVRLVGRRAQDVEGKSLQPLAVPFDQPTSPSQTATSTAVSIPTASPTSPTYLPALTLTLGAFAPYGHVLQSFEDASATPPSIKSTPANQGTATKYHRLAPVGHSFPEGVAAEHNLCLYKCAPVPLREGGEWGIRVLERHRFSAQMFSPLGGGSGRYAVVVALNGSDDKPDLSTLRVFIASSGQGISYSPGVWHHPMIALDQETDFTCLVYETGTALDCDEVFYDREVARFKVAPL